MINGLVKKSIQSFVVGLDKTRVGRYVFEQSQREVLSRIQSIQHQNTSLKFVSPNSLNRFRVNTFSTKEPETLEWIDGIPQGSVVWDIGANVGLYTCYAAKARDCKVFSFEPSVFNLEFLARNVFLNELMNNVTIIPIPLTDTMATNTLRFTTTEWGGALSTFGQDYGHDGKTLNKVFEYKTIGISILDAVNLFKIPQPDYIKMDVDGIEHLILKGGIDILRNVKGLLIEINEEFAEQKINSERYLNDAGLVFKEKRHAEMFENTIHRFGYNQIWER